MPNGSDNFDGITIDGSATPVPPWPSRPGQDDYASLFRGAGAERKVAAVKRELQFALERWWQHGALPNHMLLRDSLYLLEAGHPLGDAEQTLLLRSALFHGRGMMTALKYQSDPERTASVMRDMLLHPKQPLNPSQIRDLAQRDERSQTWLAPLRSLLKDEANQPLEPRRTLASAALTSLRADAPPPPEWQSLSRQSRAVATPAVSGNGSQKGRRGQLLSKRRGQRSALRSAPTLRFLTMLAVLFFVVSGIAFWQYWQGNAAATSQDLVLIPTGTYRITQTEVTPPQTGESPGNSPGNSPDGAAALPPAEERLVRVRSFGISRTEITNQQYQRCVTDGVCSLPRRTTSVNRPDYYLNPQLGAYPMINVTWDQAETYCLWADMRLPLAEEWQIGAASALTLNAGYRYPWGNSFEANRVNGAGTPPGDTLVVGTFSPLGDSPAGLADMAGNVAEWTATAISPEGATGAPAHLAMGGSFLSGPDQLLTYVGQAIPADDTAPWIGFRCAVTLVD